MENFCNHQHRLNPTGLISACFIQQPAAMDYRLQDNIMNSFQYCPAPEKLEISNPAPCNAVHTTRAALRATRNPHLTIRNAQHAIRQMWKPC
jgi:hypothetical protein